MAAAQKKVVVRHFVAGPAWGYLPASGLVSDGQITLLQVDGRTKSLGISDVKWIAYVRDFNLSDAIDPERIGRKSFAARPRGEGLWLRLGFHDGDLLEGLAAFDMGFIDTLLEDRGLFLAPPDGKANAQRIFVPRAALKTVELLGLVTSPSKRAGTDRDAAKAMVEKLQSELF
jgi:hypothetical protein